MRMLLASPRGINLNKLDNERRTALNLAHLRGKLYKIPQQALPPLKKPIPIGFLPNATEIERLLIEAGARKGWNEAELILSTKDGDLAQVQELIGKTDLKTDCSPVSLRFAGGTSF